MVEFVKVLPRPGLVRIGATTHPCITGAAGHLTVHGHELRPLTLGECDLISVYMSDGGSDAATDLAFRMASVIPPKRDDGALAAVESVALYLAGASGNGSLRGTSAALARYLGLALSDTLSMTVLAADSFFPASKPAPSEGWTTYEIATPPGKEPDETMDGEDAEAEVNRVRDLLAARFAQRLTVVPDDQVAGTAVPPAGAGMPPQLGFTDTRDRRPVPPASSSPAVAFDPSSVASAGWSSPAEVDRWGIPVREPGAHPDATMEDGPSDYGPSTSPPGLLGKPSDGFGGKRVRLDSPPGDALPAARRVRVVERPGVLRHTPPAPGDWSPHNRGDEPPERGADVGLSTPRGIHPPQGRTIDRPNGSPAEMGVWQTAPDRSGPAPSWDRHAGILPPPVWDEVEVGEDVAEFGAAPSPEFHALDLNERHHGDAMDTEAVASQLAHDLQMIADLHGAVR